MAHNKKAMTRLGSSGYTDNKSRSVHFVATTDAAATVLAAGYFNDSREDLEVNDVILAMTTVDGAGDLLKLKVTAVPTTGNVLVAHDVNEVVGGQDHIADLTDSSGGTANDTIAAVSGSGADAAINDNFADLAAKVNAIIANLEAAGLNATS